MLMVSGPVGRKTGFDGHERSARERVIIDFAHIAKLDDMHGKVHG